MEVVLQNSFSTIPVDIITSEKLIAQFQFAVSTGKLAKQISARNIRAQGNPGKPHRRFTEKRKFAEKAEEFSIMVEKVVDKLRNQRTKENKKITNSILIELSAILYMLDNNKTLSIKRLEFYCQKIKGFNLEKINHDQLHKIVLGLETECAKAICGEELLSNVKRELKNLRSRYKLAIQELKLAKDIKYAGVWTLIVGTLTGLIAVAVSALTGNPVGLGVGFAAYVGSIAIGGGVALVGKRYETKFKKNSKKIKEELDRLESELSHIEAEIQSIIKYEEKKAKKELGISDKSQC